MTIWWPTNQTGNVLSLSFGALSVDLEARELITDGNAGEYGYSREYDVEQYADAKETQLGASALSSPQFTSKFKFKFSLLLDTSKFMALRAIVDSQQIAIQTRQTSLAVRLFDYRFALQEKSPRSRAKHGPAISTPTPPTGYVLFWPQFDLLFTPKEDWAKLWGYVARNDPRFSIELEARELEKVPVSQDA